MRKLVNIHRIILWVYNEIYFLFMILGITFSLLIIFIYFWDSINDKNVFILFSIYLAAFPICYLLASFIVLTRIFTKKYKFYKSIKMTELYWHDFINKIRGEKQSHD